MNFPSDFIATVRELLGDESESLLSALSGDVPVSFRLNPLKSKRNPLSTSAKLQPVGWSQYGFYLDERPAFTFDPLFHAGYYYVQEAASMFVEHIIRQEISTPIVCLDLCAAPGGKSVSLLSALPEGSLLVSNELVRQRANVLSETMTKFGHPNTIVANNMAKDFSPFAHLFDLVLVDAPCSGEGMFRKDATAVEEWSIRNVEMCALRQREILNDIWPALKPGGLLIYSTCTFNSAENEENAIWIATELGAEFVTVEVEEEWGISSSLDERVTAYRFFPHKTKGEGLFVAVMRKKDNNFMESSWSGIKNKKKSVPFMKDCTAVSSFLLNPADYSFMENDHRIIALPSNYTDIFIAFKERMKVVSMGIEIAEKKGKDLIPSQVVAMNREFNINMFSRCEVSYEEAVSYLRREAINLPNTSKGYQVITYKGEVLGFVKNLGNRANNLYPNEWRIRSGYLPDNKPEIFTLIDGDIDQRF